MRRSIAAAAVAAASMLLPATASALEPCADLAGWECGSIDVAIDRADPELGTTEVSFAVRPRDDTSRPAQGTVLVSDAPGDGTINEFGAGFFPFSLGELRETRDIVLVDVRGTGAGALDCPAYQHGIGSFRESVTACAGQLGAARDFYTYGDLADDMEAVRASLGIAKVDLYATGHATPVIEAYAVRHPDRTRSVVLDSVADYQQWPGEDLDNALRVAALVCRRSTLCSAEIPDPERELAWLARRLHDRPLTGIGYDALGTPQQVRIGEAELAYNLLFWKDDGLLTQAELPAAARALRRGDPVPMLRLAAAHDLTLPSVPADQGDPAEFSNASFNAAYCSEWPFAWDRSGSADQRRRQYEAARAAMPRRMFAPFSLDAALAIFPDEQCLYWPAPARANPILGPGGSYPRVPVLAITGDLNTDHPMAQGTRVAARFPKGRFVMIPQAGQSAAGWSPCARRIIATFVRTLSTGQTHCPADEWAGLPAVGSFPLKAREFAPATVDRERDDHSRLADRRVAAVAVHTYVDAVGTALSRGGEPTGRGLRGGAYSVEFGDAGAAFTLNSLRLAEDVRVSGTTFLGFSEPNSGELTVRGPGTEDGTIRLSADPLFDNSVQRIRVDGRIGRRALSLLVRIR